MIDFEPIFKKYPYCFGYLDMSNTITPKFKKWCKENGITKYKYHLADEDNPLEVGDPYLITSTYTISFADAADAVAFKLRWC